MSSRWLSFLIAFLDYVGISIMMPVLESLSTKFHASGLQMMLAVAVYPLMQGLMGPLFGRLSDRIGRLPVLLPTVLIAGVAFLGQGVAPSFALFFVWRTIAGLTSGNVPVAQAALLDGRGEEEKAGLLGQYGLVGSLGFVAGNVLTALVALIWGDASAFLICSIIVAGAQFAAAAAMVVLGRRRGPRVAVSPSQSQIGPGRLPRASLFPLSLYLLCALVIGLYSSILPLWFAYGLGWRGPVVGAANVLMAILFGLIQGLLISRAEKSLGGRTTICVGFLLMLIGLVVSSSLPGSRPAAVLGVIALATGYGLLLPMILNAIGASFPKSAQGFGFGFANVASSLGAVLGPLLGGIIFDRGGAAAALAGGAGICAGCLGLAIVYKMISAPHRQEAPDHV